jgi:regulator of sigma E protease
MHSLVDLVRTPLAFIVVLGILVSVHEFGHYAAARLCGFTVEAFSIGFGRPIVSWVDRHGTSWQIGWLPLGGFVRLHGFERPESMTPEARAALRPGQGFHDRSLGARAIVTAAGPIANFLLTLVLFTAMFIAMGRPVPTAVLGSVEPNQAGARSGLHSGDRVLSIDGAKVDTFSDLQRIVLAHPGAPMQVDISRNGAELTLPVTPDAVAAPAGGRIGRLGVSSGPTEYRPVGLTGAIAAGADQTWYVVVQTARGLWQVITGQRGASELGGTLRIAQLSGEVAKLGIGTFVNFIAVLSVNLGLLNLLPIPLLDGGHLLFYALEAIRGRPLPARAQEYGFRLGFGVILTLVAFSVVNDLTHFGLFRWMAHLIG